MAEMMGDMDIAFPNLGIYLKNVPKTIMIGNFGIALYGVVIAIGMILGLTLAARIAKKTGNDPDVIWDLAPPLLIFSIIGARIYYVIFMWDFYKDDPIQILNLRGGGLAIYGGIIAGVLTLYIYCRVKKQKFPLVLDFVIYGLLVGQILGRWGNFFNREVFGEYTNNLFAMRIPAVMVRERDISASIVPAREVGGDLYDFYIRDEKLYFCVGDVSGKGVPAALVMAVTRSAFRTVSAHEDSAERIVTTMNNGLTDTNDSDMFVTFFCGVLDLTNGHLNYCNAGHNPPVILTDSIQPLPVEPNLPLGIVTGVDFKGQEIDLAYDDALFLYTDGVTEAENEDQEQFGEERMKVALHGRKGSMEHLNNIQKEVAAFVGSAPQSDDLTMLFIHYLGNSHENRITIDNDIKQISRLEGFVNGIASRHGLSATDASAINLALEEAVTNVVLYAYPKGQRGRIDLDSTFVDGHLEFALSDSGVEFDPTKAPDINVDASVEERPIGGLGIHLVRTIMDSVRYERKGGKNILRMTKNI